MASPVPTVDDRIAIIAQRLADAHETFRQERVPGLKTLLDDYINPGIETDSVFFHRGLLQVFKQSRDLTYERILEQHTPEEQKKIENFVAGRDVDDIGKDFIMGPSIGCRQEVKLMLQAESVFQIFRDGPRHVKGLTVQDLKTANEKWFHEVIHKLSDLFRKDSTDEDGVLVYKNAKFQNWGLNVTNTPQFTCVPATVKGIQSIVKFAAANDLSVRCSGYRHSWSPIFGRSGQVLISLIQLSTATELPNTAALPLPDSPPNQLETIEVVKGVPRVSGNALVRVGCATTNERLRRWCVEHNKWTIPLNIIMVELTQGGSISPICHGAGRRHQTTSDLVRKIEYVDCHGKLRVVEKPEHLKAAAGCFGLMGVITHITFEFAPMSYAMLSPIKMPVVQAVPPPPDMSDDQIPPALLKGVDRSPIQKQKDQADFERRAMNDYYAEWFWFPFSDYSWINTWNNVTDPSGVVPFPNDVHLFLSFVQTVTLNILQYTPLLDELIDAVHMSEAAVTLISRAAMFALPDKKLKTYVPDALHFTRSIQNVRVMDLEIEMPLVAKAGGQAGQVDFSVVQRAWWDALLTVYEPRHRAKCPMRMPLEMRIMGGSDMVMAPQRYNKLGTASIEVLTLQSQSEEWRGFAQEVLDKWMNYADPNTGERLNTRPHWAKEWEGYLVDGRPWEERLKKESYKKEIEEFKGILKGIGAEHGWTLEELKARFSNDLFDGLVFDDVGVAGRTHANGSK